MCNKLFVPVAICTVLFGGSVWAEPANSLKDSVERSILNNPEIRFKHQNLLAITGEQDAAKGGWFPRIDVSMNSGKKNSLKPGETSSDSYANSTTTLQLRQMLFDGFSTNSNVSRLGHSRLASYYALLSASDQIALETVGAYLDVLRYRELVTFARENYATHADVHARLEGRVKAGVSRGVDLEQAAGRMALAESNWVTEASNLHEVSTRYQRLVGETPANALQPPPNLTKLLPSLENFVGNTVRSNPDFLGAVSTLRAYRADAKLQASPNYPSLEFVASQSLEKNRYGVSGGASGEYRDSAVQLVLNYNLYRGGSDSARIRQYAAKLNSAFDLRDKTCRDVRQTALIAINDVNKLEKQIGLLAQHELSTAKAREAYRTQFDIGQRSLLDLLDTENELFQARRATINAQTDYQLAKARVLTVNGSLLLSLQLRPIQSEVPPLVAGTEVNDDELLCDTALPASLILDKVALLSVSAPLITVAPVRASLVAPPPAPNKAICQSITPTVEKWIAAWSKKDIKGYFAVYSDAFVPAQDLKRAQWETLRKNRINKQGSISTVLKNITPSHCDSKTSEVSFTQEYGSVDYRDSVEKTLSMEYVSGQWKIIRETVTKGRTF